MYIYIDKRITVTFNENQLAFEWQVINVKQHNLEINRFNYVGHKLTNVLPRLIVTCLNLLADILRLQHQRIMKGLHTNIYLKSTYKNYDELYMPFDAN